MKITVIAVGQRMPDWVQTAWQDYSKRLPRECALVLKEIKAEPRNTGKTPQQLMAAEAQRIQIALPAHSQQIVLDERGRDITTADLVQLLAQWISDQQDVSIVIGGPDGLDSELKATAHQRLRLSSLTLPHPMVRVLLAEQLYRAWSILNNHPYHRE